MPDEPALPPLLLDGPQVAALLSISLSSFHAMRAMGQFPLPPLHLRRCVRWRVADVRAWVAAGMPAESRWRAINAIRRTDMRKAV
jgi:predicted DNA-binding transcriptional regulator AlpA